MKNVFLMSLGLVLSAPVLAAEDIRLSVPNQSDFQAITEDLTGAFSYKPLAPAEPLGLLGFHAGGMLSYTDVENEGAWRRITAGESFKQLALVGVMAGKGLIGGLDVGAFYADSPDTNVSVYGAELRYAFAEGGLISPALSVRASYTKMDGAEDLDFDTKGLDVSISKGFLLLTPYVGMGRIWGEATPHVVGLETAEAHNNKLYAGLRISLTLLQINLEADQTGDNSSYSLRVGVGF